MARTVLAALLILATLAPAPLRAAEAPEADLATGIRQVQEGDFETAVVTLQGVTRKLEGQTTRRQALAQAHLYLGIAHVALDQSAEAKTAFKAALTQNKELRLTPDRFSPKVIAAFEEARREVATTRPGTASKSGGGKPLLWVAVGGAAAAAVALAASGGGNGPSGNVTVANARFATPVIECPNGSDNLELPYSVLVDADNQSSRPLTIQDVNAVAVITRTTFPGELGFSSFRPSTVAPTTVAAGTRGTLRVESTLLCGNGAGDPARFNEWVARISFNTSAGVFNVETADRMRVDIP